MRTHTIAIIAGISLALPATASADAVVGAAVLNQGPTPYTNIQVAAGISLGPAAPLGTIVGIATDGRRVVSTVRCINVQGSRASVVAVFVDPLGSGQGDFRGQVFWFEDRGLLGLFGAVDAQRNFRLDQSELDGAYSTCPSTTPPAGLPAKEIQAGDLTVIDS